jgi:hypothetical protein
MEGCRIRIVNSSMRDSLLKFSALRLCLLKYMLLISGCDYSHSQTLSYSRHCHTLESIIPSTKNAFRLQHQCSNRIAFKKHLHYFSPLGKAATLAPILRLFYPTFTRSGQTITTLLAVFTSLYLANWRFIWGWFYYYTEYSSWPKSFFPRFLPRD